MNPRLFLFMALAAIHLALFVFRIEPLTPLLAGSVYLPLMAFQSIGMPVFMDGHSGGWAAPSILGWGLCLALWAAVWWIVSGLVVRYAASSKNKV